MHTYAFGASGASFGPRRASPDLFQTFPISPGLVSAPLGLGTFLVRFRTLFVLFRVLLFRFPLLLFVFLLFVFLLLVFL